MEYNWYSFVPTLWRLQRFNEANSLHNFVIIPQGPHGRKAIRIDTKTMALFVNNSLKRGEKIDDKDKIRVWSKYINYFKFETGERHFDFAMITDGASFAVLQFARAKKTEKELADIAKKKEKRWKEIQRKYTNNEYNIIGGIDEGLKLMVACHATYRDGDQTKVKLTKYKSKTFQYDSGQLYFKRKCHRITKQALESKEKDRKVFDLQQPNENMRGFRLLTTLRDEDLIKRRKKRHKKVMEKLLKLQEKNQLSKKQSKYFERLNIFNKTDLRHRIELSPTSWNYADYVRFELKHLEQLQSVLINEKLAHYKFKRSIFITKTATNIAQQLAETGTIVGSTAVPYRHEDRDSKISIEMRREKQAKFKEGKRSTLLIVGDLRMLPNSPMKGHPRTARGQFVRALQHRCDVIFVDEHNTTKLCALCNGKLEVAKPPKRFSQCIVCVGNKRRVWNRDTNAAHNIKCLGELQLNNKQRPALFCKGAIIPEREKIWRRKRNSNTKESSDSDSASTTTTTSNYQL